MPAADDLEIELKLEAEPADLALLAGAPILGDTTLATREQCSTYFDTPDRALRAAGLSLRVRRTGDRHVQTVKAEGTAAAGLFVRPEWEREIADERPVIDTATGPLTTLIPEATLGAIAPAFSVEVSRRVGLLTHEGAVIELVLDDGEVIADARRAAVAEVELELKSGPPAALFSLARAINAVVPVRLGVLAKSDRGYRLLDGAEPKSVKAQAGVLAGKLTSAEGFQAIVGACLRQFRLNEAILARIQAPEPLHQARVALRRLRSALAIFGGLVADDRFDHFRGELRWLAATLGDARDIDVLLQRTGSEHEERLRAARVDAYAVVAAALGSQRVRTLMIDLSEWIAIGAWRIEPADAGLLDRPADRFAADTLDRMRRKVKRRGRDLKRLTDEERHDVRILAKKLRYASEFFSGLSTSKKAARRTKPFLAALEKLQQHLGDLNDIAHGPEVLARLGIATEEIAVDPKQRAALIEKAVEAHAVLGDTKRFWR